MAVALVFFLGYDSIHSIRSAYRCDLPGGPKLKISPRIVIVQVFWSMMRYGLFINIAFQNIVQGEIGK